MLYLCFIFSQHQSVDLEHKEGNGQLADDDLGHDEDDMVPAPPLPPKPLRVLSPAPDTEHEVQPSSSGVSRTLTKVGARKGGRSRGIRRYGLLVSFWTPFYLYSLSGKPLPELTTSDALGLPRPLLETLARSSSTARAGGLFLVSI